MNLASLKGGPAYRVTLERTRTINAIRRAGKRYSYTLRGPKSVEAAREYVQRHDCDHRPWRIVSIEAEGVAK